MASEFEFVNFKDFVNGLPAADDFAAGDKTVLSGTTLRKMDKDVQLQKTAENTLVHVDILTKSVSKTHVFSGSDSLEYEWFNINALPGQIVSISFNSLWEVERFEDSTNVVLFDLYDAVDGNVVERCDNISKEAFLNFNSPYTAKIFPASSSAWLRVAVRGDSGESVDITVGLNLIDEVVKNGGLANEVEKQIPYTESFVEMSTSSLDFEYGNISSNDGSILPTQNLMTSKLYECFGVGKVKLVCAEGYRVTIGCYKNGDGVRSFVSKADFIIGGGYFVIPPECGMFRVSFATLQGSGIVPTYNDSGLGVFFVSDILEKAAPLSLAEGLSDDVEELIVANEIKFTQGRLSSVDGRDLSRAEDPDRFDKAVKSDYIRIDGMSVFGVVGTDTYSSNVYLYDENKNYVSNTGRSNTRYVKHTGYVRVVVFTADATGDISPDNLDFSKLFFQQNVPSAKEVADSSVTLSIQTVNSSKVYDYLDSQTKRHSSYMQKSLLCTEASGLPIYKYTLGNGAKKILIISGQHGPKSDPAEHAVTCCNLVDILCNNKFLPGSFLEKIKRNYTLVVIPILNPYGFDNFNLSFDGPGGRNNSNGVNLNSDWVDFTQVETQSARDFIQSFGPDVVVDLHTTGNYDGEGDSGFLWGRISSQSIANGINSNISPYMQVDYGLSATMGVAEVEGTASYYIKNVLEKVGGTVELQWFVHNVFGSIHDSQVLSCDLSWLINILYYLAVSAGLESAYAYQLTPQVKSSF